MKENFCTFARHHDIGGSGTIDDCHAMENTVDAKQETPAVILR